MNSLQKNILGARLRQCRAERSQSQFARELGISQPNYHRYEAGTSTPKGDVLLKIAQHCDTTAEWLLGGKTAGIKPQGESATAPPADEQGDTLTHLEMLALKQQPQKVADLEARVAALEQAVVRMAGKAKGEAG